MTLHNQVVQEPIFPCLPSKLIPHLRLPEVVREEMLSTAIQYMPTSSASANVELVGQARSLAQTYLAILKPFLADLKIRDGIDFAVISNLPVDPYLPKPPSQGTRPMQKKTWVSELSLLAVALATGLKPFSYQQERGNALVHEIAPSSSHAQTLSSLGKTTLGFHTDLSILKPAYQPDVLALMALLNPSQTPTLLARLEDALVILRQEAPSALSVLEQPRFRACTPHSLTIGKGKVVYSEPKPLLVMRPGHSFEVTASLQTLAPVDKEAHRAVEAFQSALEQVALPILLTPGSLLIFNNHRCLHGRPPIVGERWLQRVYGRWSLKAIHRTVGTTQDPHIFDIRPLILD